MRAAQGMMPTSPRKRFKSIRGFTLIEMMVVLALVAAIVVVAVPRLENSGTKLKRAVRHLSTISKRLHHLARLNRVTYRLVLEMSEDPDEPHRYWVEVSNRKVTVATEEQLEELARSQSDEEKKAGDGFNPDPTIIKRPQELPRGLFFEDVELSTRNSIVQAGRAHIHFMPEGFAEEAAIHLTDRENLKWSIVIHPLTGVAIVYPEYKSLKDLQQR